MARGDQLARQWKIFQTLVTSRYGKSVSDLAKNLDCHQRTIFIFLKEIPYIGQFIGIFVHLRRPDFRSTPKRQTVKISGACLIPPKSPCR